MTEQKYYEWFLTTFESFDYDRYIAYVRNPKSEQDPNYLEKVDKIEEFSFFTRKEAERNAPKGIAYDIKYYCELVDNAYSKDPEAERPSNPALRGKYGAIRAMINGDL